MTASWRGLLVTAIVAFAAGLGGVWLGMRAFHEPPPPGLHEVVHEKLGLTQPQRARIEAIESAFEVRKRALELDMQAANADLAIAIRDEHGFGPRVTAAIERFHHAMGELQSETIRHVFAMREVLTPSQQATFDETVVAALTADAR